ncbi:O-antigen ligase family protein [Mucilaginibacter psychrotolerans]|uniref:O-antigen ligase family protein n=1 Tax=Mucilaginibacter psychrotolerans TaxID=1524096 RepID=A0A4Y8SHS5_9SPHI|nr:O-antigen ligase family protein [Mucilaginibacter psychrotolerans]TFF38210.1 O-antigen ligase family protein [Mucilaginibacter psychrotolerans]
MPTTLKELFPRGDSLANRISYYHMALLLLSLPYDMFYSHLILISFILHTLIHLKRAEVKPLITRPNLALASIFFLTVAATIYSINKPVAFAEWGKQITILLFPLVFCLNPINLKKYRAPLLLTFALGSTVAILYLYLQAFRAIRFYHLPLSAIYSADFTNHNFAGPLEIHATFFSMQIALALAYMLTELIKTKSAGYRALCIWCTVVLATGIIQLSSKSVSVALLVIINIAAPVFLLRGKVRLRYAAVTLSVSALLIVGIYHMDNFKERYITDLKTDLSKAKADELFDPRLARWQLALKLAAKSPVIGHGAGTEIGLLKEEFFGHHFYRSYLAGLNAHSEFISLLIKAGLAGLLVYLFTLYFGFRQAIRSGDVLLFSFMLIIATVSFSENLLDVDKGIFFYSLFFSFLVYSGQEQTGAAVNRRRKTHTYGPPELITAPHMQN